jgi:hypothetical protein
MFLDPPPRAGIASHRAAARPIPVRMPVCSLRARPAPGPSAVTALVGALRSP